jgi:hypothetical protein
MHPHRINQPLDFPDWFLAFLAVMDEDVSTEALRERQQQDAARGLAHNLDRLRKRSLDDFPVTTLPAGFAEGGEPQPSARGKGHKQAVD